MKNSTLLELVAKWERDAKEPEIQDGSEGTKIDNATAKGLRIGLNLAAFDVRMLIKLIGDSA